MLSHTKSERWRNLLVVLLVLAGTQQLGASAYTKAKAHVAQYLIARAWFTSAEQAAEAIKPWPWADTWPVARLEIPRHAVDLYVLSGAAGNSLAFGPGYETASARLLQPGLSVIGGHRDTHFSFLEHLQPNTLMSLELPSGKRKVYRVDDTRIVDTRLERIETHYTVADQLQLVTCYPFNSLRSGGPLRYVVTATALSPKPRIAANVASFVPPFTTNRAYEL